MIKVTLTLVLLFLLTGCASIGKQWKEFLNGRAQPTAAQAKPQSTTFSDTNNLPPSQYRQYRRTKRKDFEDGAQLDSRAGSLWVMEGQGAYLFSQNIVRMIGDPIAVKIEGDPQEQLASKTKVISKLLTQIEERRKRAQGRNPAGEAQKADTTASVADPAAAPVQNANAANPNIPAGAVAGSEDNKDFSVKMVPTRVVERLVDGNYRVRGTQPFMIGNREYRVIVSGIVRAEDFNDQGISAAQMIDSNFDVVSAKSTETR